MRKMSVACLVIIICILPVTPVYALPQTIDLDTITYAEAIALKDQLNLAIWNSENWQEVTVPQGIYAIGEDIPAGHWSISAAEGAYSHIKWAEELNEAKTDYEPGTRLALERVISEASPIFDANQSRVSLDLELTADTYLIIEEGSAVFTPYQGKPTFTFKNPSPSGEQNVAPTNTPLATKGPELTAEPAQIKEPLTTEAEHTPSPTKDSFQNPASSATNVVADSSVAAEQYLPLSKGDKGDEVLKLQNRLKELNYLDGSPDGAYGGKTESAIKSFQSTVGLPDTGEADVATQAALFSNSAPEALVYGKLEYKKLERDPQQYQGSLVKFDGYVWWLVEDVNTDGETTNVTMGIATKGKYDNVVYVSYERDGNDSRILENDRVTIYGQFEGLYSYTSVTDVLITLPEVSLHRIDRK